MKELEWVEYRASWWGWAIHGTKEVNSNYNQGKAGIKELFPFFWRNSHTQEYTFSAHLDLESGCEARACVLGGGKEIFM